MARRGLALLLIATVVAASACANDGRRAADTTASTVPRTTIVRPTTTLGDLTGSGGFAASIRQYREDDLTGVVQVQLWRGSASDAAPGSLGTQQLTVESVQLHWPGFTQAPPGNTARVMVPGQRLDFPTPASEVICRSDGGRLRTPSWEEGSVTVTGTSPAGPFSVEAPLLEDAATTLTRIHERDCEEQAMRSEVSVSLPGPWRRADQDTTPVAVASVHLERLAAEAPIEVVAVSGSVLLTLTSPLESGGTVATMAPEDDRLDVPVELVGSGRCDGHAVGESKKTFEFQVTIRIGSEEPVGVDVSVDEADRPTLFQLIRDTCGNEHLR